MNKQEILKWIEIALKGELNNIMMDGRSLDRKKVEQRHDEIMNYLKENMK